MAFRTVSAWDSGPMGDPLAEANETLGALELVLG
jgi:hypothetical protein